VSAVDNALIEMYDGTPRVRISPYCRTLIVGAAGRYFNEKDETGELKPCKNRYSHVCNAWEYGMIGIGEGRRMIGLTALSDLKPVRVYRGAKTMRRVVA
jgi:hypothetical protein